MQIVPVHQRLRIEVYPSSKGEDYLYGAFALQGIQKTTFDALSLTIELESKPHGGFDFKKPEKELTDHRLAEYVLERSNQNNLVTECFYCPNFIYSDKGKFGEGAMCPTCAVNFYREQERVLEEEQHNQNRLERAAKLAVKTGISAETLADVLLYRPRLEKVFQNLLPAKIDRFTEELANGIYISNDAEPLFQIGRWGSPFYNSCQDWRNLSWADVYLRSMHQLEDPDILVLWKGGPEQMQARYLVRRARDAKADGKLLLAIDAWYGMREFEPEMTDALVEFAKRDGSEVVHVSGRPSTSMLVSRTPAKFSNATGSYADIGKWHALTASGHPDLKTHIAYYYPLEAESVGAGPAEEDTEA